jgi:branched-chain amino acid transport system ATP-binding protein
MSEALLKVNNLDAYYGDFQALYDINIEVKKSEIVAIIGSNGAGKSTLLKSISGLVTNRSEMIGYNGSLIGSLRPDQISKLGIALVPEGRQLFPSLSVEENLLIGSRKNTLSSRWTLQKVIELFPFLEARLTSTPFDLSGGQQQMVAIGRALMGNPKCILFDEISLGLAPVIIKSIYKALPDIIEGGVSAIIVEQDIAMAKSVSNRLYCLQEGRVSLSGSSDTVSFEDIRDAYFGVRE